MLVNDFGDYVAETRTGEVFGDIIYETRLLRDHILSTSYKNPFTSLFISFLEVNSAMYDVSNDSGSFFLIGERVGLFICGLTAELFWLYIFEDLRSCLKLLTELII